MDRALNSNLQLPPEQQAIRDKCFHPSGTFVEFPIEDVESSVCARFEKIAAQYRDNWAIVSDAQSLTYAKLNERANGVARSILERLGAGSQPIGVLFDTKLALIVAMLGVLKAGKVIVLLDAAAPSARLINILNDTRSRLLLTEPALRAKALDLRSQQAQVLDIGTCANDCGGNLQLPIEPETPLAISYTGGSTGAPKGVILSHRHLLHQAMLFANTFHYCDQDRISYLVSGSSAALYHPFVTLLAGASVFPFDVKRFGVEALGTWLSQKEISICSLSAPLFRVFANIQIVRLDLPNLRVLRLSSEASYKADFALYRERFPRSCLLANGIGPTETSLLSLYFMDHDSVIDTDEIPIGYPVQDKEILLIDDGGQEVGFDQVGEIAVRSAYLSSGYWDRPELTSAKFTAARTYFTGDLGLRRSDGCLIYKGRKDFRVKIRGYPVEPAEVEASMRQHPAIRDICVAAMGDGISGDRRLVAYFTQDSDRSLGVPELRSFLKHRLPDYMIPAAFVPMAKFPLGPNGKVDRSALPSPAISRSASMVPYVAPSNEQECRLTNICCEVLGLAATGIHDNFFDLGGNSLSAMRVLSRVKKEFAVDLWLSDFYESPTISSLAALIQRCSPAKPQNRTIAFQPGARIEPLPLSFGQERLWFLEQLEPHARRYNLVAAFSLEGKFDVGALEWAINQIVKRHESLRTVFRSNDGKPFAVVLDQTRISVSTVDIAPLSKETGDQALHRVCAEEACRPFDLTSGPLFRPTIVKANAKPIALILVIHHLVFDGWSMDILCRELSANYQAALTRQSFEPPPLPIQYADFAIWQRDRLQDQSLDAHLVFWREQLAEASVLQLPLDRRRPQFRDVRATRQWFTIAPPLTQLLKDTSRESGVTLFMTLLAVYQTLLFRYSGQEDICVGVPVAGRTEEALDDVIGFFLNMLVLRADLSGNPSFIDFLARVRHRCLEAYAHQEVPFERVVEQLQPKRIINQHPLFQVSFTLRHGGACALHLNGLAVEELEVDPGMSRFDLEFYMEERDGGLHGFLAGSADLFDAATIARMAGNYQNLLQTIVANPKQRVGELPLLTAPEKHQLLIEWNDTERDYPKDKCIHEFFEEQAAKTPDAVAVLFEGQQLTYGELNIRTNRLAQYLRKVGVGPEVLVGVCVERSIEMIVGLLAILKAGGAYVPLDSGYPKERLAFMLADAQVSILLTQEGLLEDGGSRMDDSDCRSSILSRPIQRICLDRDWELIARESDANPESTATADNLAYVIYTSGSTGQPKGVSITHKSLLNLVFWHHQAFSVTPIDRATQLAATGFDAAVWELWPYLTVGASVHIPDDMTRLDAAALRDWLVAQAVTISFVPIALAETLMTLDWPAETALRVLLTGGDALRVYPPDTLPFSVFNNYGPTECTVVATSGKVGPNAHPLAPPTIGRPIANTQVYILDAYRNLVPIGVVGEIYIGGDGVARGYLNRPELTAERFIHHSFDGKPEQRLYKTGDRARYLPDGNIEFLGRLDSQVKIRGYRIELGEIEAVLSQHPTVLESLVVAQHDALNKRLVAYVVHRPGADTSVSELREFLKQKLPDYMIPSVFVVLDALPLTPNGKVDRRALPAPDQSRPELEQSYYGPRTPVERKLAEIWAEVLNVKEIGVHDNFFDLGGHSLLATQLISRVRAAFHIEVALRTLFERPTVAELTKAILAQQSATLNNTELAGILTEIENYSDT